MADPEDEREVLTSLPRSRPTRRSSKRADRGEAAPPASERPKRKPRQRPSKAPPSAAQAPPDEPAERPRTSPKRKVPPAGYAAPAGGDPTGSPGPTEMLSTAIQAVTELAQIGFSVGRQVLQSALERLPKP